MLGLFWWLAWERPTDGSRGRVWGRHASPRVAVVRRRGGLELVKLLHGDTSVHLQIVLHCFLYHHKSSSQTIMFSPENHLDTRAASSPRDGSSSTLCTRTLSAFCLCVGHIVVCVGNYWIIDEKQGLSRLLQRGGASKTLQRWEPRWFGKHFKQKIQMLTIHNTSPFRPGSIPGGEQHHGKLETNSFQPPH